MGELLNALHEEGLLISLICHAPVTMTSTKYSVFETGAIKQPTIEIFRVQKLPLLQNGVKNSFSGRLFKSSGKENQF